MLTLHSKIPAADLIAGQLILRYDQREKSRLRATLSNGEEVALYTVRGSVLRDGDLLRGDDGRVVQIVAAPESVYRVECVNPHELLRCAFHLGNRHTQAQIVAAGEHHSFLRIRQDSVLKEMLEGLGATVVAEEAPFEPESGAYGGGHHHHGDDAADGHAHAGNSHAGHHGQHPLAPIPLRQKIHRGTDPKEG